MAKRRKRSLKSTLKLVGFCLAILIIVTISNRVIEIVKLNSEREMLEIEKARLERQKENLELELDSISTEEYIESLARKDLKLIKSNELLFILPSQEEDGNDK